MMDDLSYSKNTFSKLELYNSHGLIPSVNLITTFETKNNPLNSQMIEKIIQHYFLWNSYMLAGLIGHIGHFFFVLPVLDEKRSNLTGLAGLIGHL